MTGMYAYVSNPQEMVSNHENVSMLTTERTQETGRGRPLPFFLSLFSGRFKTSGHQ
jgi:hypothetical protein